jgi:hypothetical protein
MGIEPPVDSSAKTAASAKGGAESGALPDARYLQPLASAIRGLSPGDRARLAMMLLEGQAERKEG